MVQVMTSVVKVHAPYLHEGKVVLVIGHTPIPHVHQLLLKHTCRGVGMGGRRGLDVNKQFNSQAQE